MPTCYAFTTLGSRCKKSAHFENDFCNLHRRIYIEQGRKAEFTQLCKAIDSDFYGTVQCRYASNYAHIEKAYRDKRFVFVNDRIHWFPTYEFEKETMVKYISRNPESSIDFISMDWDPREFLAETFPNLVFWLDGSTISWVPRTT